MFYDQMDYLRRRYMNYVELCEMKEVEPMTWEEWLDRGYDYESCN